MHLIEFLNASPVNYLAVAKLVEQLQAADELVERVFLRGEGVQAVIDFHDRFLRERDPVRGVLQHLGDARELVLAEQAAAEQVRRELDRDLADVFGRAAALLPDVFEVLAGDEDQVQVGGLLHAVADDAAQALPVLDEVELVFPVLVQRVGELALVPLDDVETVAVGNRSNLPENVCHNATKVINFCTKTVIIDTFLSSNP